LRANSPNPMDQETHYKLLSYLDDHPDVTQRELAEHLGVSLGKVNYCLKALMGRGLIKARNFKSSDNKRAYLYVLTPAGIENKAKITIGFLHRKIEEFEQLKTEIKELQQEVSNNGDSDSRAGGASK
jgi:EPS-associated MarR family transcriptional regulator